MERICHLTNLGERQLDLSMIMLPQILGNTRNVFAVLAVIERMDGSLEDVFAPHLASFDVRSVRDGARTRRNAVGAAG